METIANAFNLFINTDRNIANGSLGDDVVIPLGESPIVAGDDEHIRITLDQFSMCKSWYDINSNNNTFTLQSDISGNTEEIIIPEGDYSPNDPDTFVEQLGEQLRKGMVSLYNLGNEKLTVQTNDYSEVTKKYTIVIKFADNGAWDIMITNGFPLLQCFTAQGDAYKVLGGTRIVGAVDAANKTNSVFVNLDATALTLTITPKFKINLTPETHVYLAVDNQMSNNIATNSFTAENTQSTESDREGMTSSRIMAAIPIDTYHASYNSRTNRLFFIDLASRVATSLKLVLLDSCGRRFPFVGNNAEQGVFGDRSFQCTMRVDILKSKKTGTLQTKPTPKSVPPRFSSTPATVLNLGIPGYGLNVPGQVYGDGYDALAS